MHNNCGVFYVFNSPKKLHAFNTSYYDIHRIVQDPDAKIKDIPLTPAELKEYQDREEKLKNFIANMRLELAKVNREVLHYTLAIDEVPGTAELLQYEKRFIELYNQGKFSYVHRHLFFSIQGPIYVLFYRLACKHAYNVSYMHEATCNQSILTLLFCLNKQEHVVCYFYTKTSSILTSIFKDLSYLS